MTIAIDPTLFASSALSWASPAALAGIALGLAFMMRQAPRLGLTRRDTYAVGLRGVLWGLLGARLLHVADYAGFYADAPFRAFYVWEGGLALWGAVLAGSAGAVWHARRRGASVGRFADALAVAGLAGMAVGRAGDFIAGATPGALTSLPWGVVYAHPRSEAFAAGAAVHPVALYELCLDLGVLGLLLWGLSLRRAPQADGGPIGWRGHFAAALRALPDGAGLVAAVSLYGAGRFLISFARTDPTHLGLQEAQWAALAVLAVAGVYAWRRRLRGAA